MKITKSNTAAKKLATLGAAFALVLGVGVNVYSGAAFAAKQSTDTTVVPGQQKRLTETGYAPAGVWVNGHYTALYAYDVSGAYYWDLGDGRVQSSANVSSVADLDQSTLTTCDYVINYRADFGGNPYMDQGSIHNNIKCSGAEKGTYNSVIVSNQDPRYTGNPDYAIWGNWEYIVDTASGLGNGVHKMPRL
jgi:hypothetical protein